MKKLIIIPAYNEAASIENTVKSVRQSSPDYDFVIINDCSTDETAQICKRNHYNYVDLPVNLGIGGAVQTGYKYAYNNNYDIAVQIDADGQHNSEYLDKMADELVKKNADMIIGSRFIENVGFQSTFLRRVGIVFFSKLIKILTGGVVTDPTSGLRMVGKGGIELFAKEYPSDYPEPETATALLCRGYRVVEMPVVMNERQGGQSSINAVKSIYYMLKVTLAIFVETSRGKGLIWKQHE